MAATPEVKLLATLPPCRSPERFFCRTPAPPAPSMAGKDADAQGDMVLVLPSFGPPKPSRPLSPPHAGMDRHLRVLDDWNATAVNPWPLDGDAPLATPGRRGRVVIGQPPGPPDGPAAGSGARARAGRPGRGRRRCGGWSRRFFGACGGGACSGKAGRHPRARERQRGRGARFIVVGWRPAPRVLGPTSQAPKGQGHVPEVAAQRAREVEHDSPTVTVLTFLDVPARRRFFAVDLGDDIAALRSQISGATQTAAGEIVLTARGRLLTDGQRVHQIGDREIGDRG